MRMDLDAMMEDTWNNICLAIIIILAVTGISYLIHSGSDVTRQAYYSDWFINLISISYQVPV